MEVRGAALRFKIREPIQTLERKKVRDVRSLSRGAVCETRPRSDQTQLAAKLTRQPRSALLTKSTPELCTLVRDHLLTEEENARNRREAGPRWFYLFSDDLPVIRAAA